MFRPWYHQHHNFTAAMHGNPYFYRQWRRGPSRLLWFMIGAGSATVFIAHREAHEGGKSRYWSHCFRAPIQVPHSLPSSPNQLPTPGPIPPAHPEIEPWQRLGGRLTEQQWMEERERIAAMKRHAQDTMSVVSESTLDALILTVESIKAKLEEQKAREKEADEKRKQEAEASPKPSRWV